MSLFEEYRLVYIDSNKGEGTSENFTIDLGLDPSIDYTHVCLISADIPSSYYQVQLGYQDFAIIEDGVKVVVTIGEGNYKKKTFATEVTTQLNASSPNGWTYEMLYQPRIEKYKITVTGNGGLQPTLSFSGTLFKHFGFNKNTSNVFIGGELSSTNVIDLSGESILLLRTNMPFVDYGSNILHEVFTAGYPPMSRIRFENKSIEAYSKKLAPDFNTSNFNFLLTSEPEETDSGEFVQLNGLPVFYTLLFYKKSDINSVLKDNIALNLLS